jgi:hypothetical protein
MKLNQVIAVEKGIKQRIYTRITELHKQAQKPEMYYGFTKKYTPKDEKGETFPDEFQKVQLRADEVLEEVSKLKEEYINIVATKDAANTHALGNITVRGQIILADVPVSTLLFLEKELQDLNTFVSKMPVLDDSLEWNTDEASDLYKTESIRTQKTMKVPEVLVKYEATPQHPAQTELITLDRTVGHWDTVKQSAAITRKRKKQILDNIQDMMDAVKVAREEANGIEVTNMPVGQLLSYIFA